MAATSSGAGATIATVHGLAAASGHSFTVVARDAYGRTSAPSKAVAITTPPAAGPVAYEAEAPGNTLVGGASVADCAGCSGGKKAGNLGGAGNTLTCHGVTAPADGTYLMRLDYVDGSSGRTAVITVDGASFQLPLAGSNDNDWGTAQSVTIPVHLKAGANTIGFGNPTDNVSDIDKITL